MMKHKKALVVGLGRYKAAPLKGPLIDARKIRSILTDAGYHVQMLPGRDKDPLVGRAQLRSMIALLFQGSRSVRQAIFFFAGHGCLTNTGGVLVTEDGVPDDPGVGMHELLEYANNSDIEDRVVLLDCCASGAFGDLTRHATTFSGLSTGVTLLAACRDNEKAGESTAAGGLFTSRLAKGLEGFAADDHGRITTATLYSYLDDNFEAWSSQRPVYKTNIEYVEPIMIIPSHRRLCYLAKRCNYKLNQEIDASLRKDDRTTIVSALDELLPNLQQKRRWLVDWGAGANKWISEFYDYESVKQYSSVFSTDLESRSSIGSPVFERYLRKQYKVRINALSFKSTPIPVYFSAAVMDAIQRTGWEPDSSLWTVCDRPNRHSPGPEMARILVRNTRELTPETENALWVLDHDHKLYGIPLFVVVDPKIPDVPDFAVAIDSDGKAVNCFEYIEDRCAVERQEKQRGTILKRTFFQLLESKHLMTVRDFIGTPMLNDIDRSRIFFQNYDANREASPLICDLISKYIPSQDNLVGMDVGCGSGNYITPFLDRFSKIIGLDINRDAIDVAKNKFSNLSGKVKLVIADTVDTDQEAESIDFVWSVSVLHYLKGLRQERLINELFRILRSNGRLFLDVGEFAEQHPSLWVTHYFPSLKQRYKNSLHSRDTYFTWLTNAGFSRIEFVSAEYPCDEPDKVIRSGQHCPELYLSEDYQQRIPAFLDMPEAELETGTIRLKQDIDSGKLDEIIKRHDARANMEGDVGFIFAVKENF